MTDEASPEESVVAEAEVEEAPADDAAAESEDDAKA